MTRSSMAVPGERRTFLQTLGSTLGLALTACSTAATHGAEAKSGHAEAEPEEAEVTPGEDLMQEHGVLERILLIYDEAAHRIEGGESLDASAISTSADIVRRFVQDYHEKLEEQFVFPRLQQAKREAELVAVLLEQHQRGRELTEAIARAAGAPATPDLARALRAFVRMYRPHASREETVLFPAFREVVGRSSYRELGEQFEDEEHRRFGEHGFSETVSKIAAVERSLGIYELAAFTPARAPVHG